MSTGASIRVPSLVRMKPGALDRLGLYLRRAGRLRVLLLASEGLVPALLGRARAALAAEGVAFEEAAVPDASFEAAGELFAALPRGTAAVVGLGGGKALDVAKYVAHLARLPYAAAPTSLSNDGFCSPQSSLTLRGARRSLPATLPDAVVVDTEVCLGAPMPLWHSGVGDLASKITAVADWKRAFHATGEPVNDLAALLSDATVFQFLASPARDPEGVRLLATALMLNGVAMEICGSSRPASGSEHLVSHALDAVCVRPRLHGLQVGVATYLASLLQGGHGTGRVAELFDATGFWEGAAADPIPRAEWLEACRRAPGIKPGYHTVLSERDWLPEIERLTDSDPRLRRCVR
ncbi:MAG: iron-containing alcohol dehydrogenase family protein [Candidatus Sumerlaeia bacterium]|nr:iron-containing alcohol dehydrogenase family protein [Candidatus Sumerlaeia bacterium]